MSGTVLDPGEMKMNKADKVPTLTHVYPHGRMRMH